MCETMNSYFDQTGHLYDSTIKIRFLRLPLDDAF